MIDFRTGAPISGDLAVRWNHGARRDADPAIQVHAYDDHTFVLRQTMAVHYEAPFIYLFHGNERALLLDTGATAEPDRFPLRDTVDSLLDGWLAEHPRAEYGLVVVHTHGHGDHVAGDAQFDGRPRTTVVAADLAAVRSFFGFTDWPAEVVLVDLGGRVLAVTGIPGHHGRPSPTPDREPVSPRSVAVPPSDSRPVGRSVVGGPGVRASPVPRRRSARGHPPGGSAPSGIPSSPRLR